MNVIETIQQKIIQLPPQAQEEILEIIEQIEERYQSKTEKKEVHPLTLIAEMAIDTGVTDLAERHDFYAPNKLED
ncbi:MAG: hypothetical protein ACR2HG_06985 [Pyrinomonadaceae bacterium]